MDWVIERLNNKNGYKQRKSGDINAYTKESKRLKVCTKCNLVWEVSYAGSILHYDCMPTYGLKRKTCKQCKKEAKNGQKRKTERVQK